MIGAEKSLPVVLGIFNRMLGGVNPRQKYYMCSRGQSYKFTCTGRRIHRKISARECS